MFLKRQAVPHPNLSKIDGANDTPQIATKDTVIELGDYTFQKFSGESSHVERANILARRSKLLTAVIEALETANDVEAIQSEITSDNYLIICTKVNYKKRITM